jgi:hypothetical protein
MLVVGSSSKQTNYDTTANRMNLEDSKVLNIEKYGNTTSATLPLVHDFEHLFKRRYNNLPFLEVSLGIYLFKMGIRQNKFKLKTNNGFKKIQNLIKFVANSGVAEVKLEMDDVKSPSEQL